jgi:hypothetical protein
MRITFACPTCGTMSTEDGLESKASLECRGCGTAIAIPSGSVGPGRIDRCVVCPSRDLFVRKDFPQRLGIGIVVVGFAASCVAWGMRELAWTFGILFATAAIDVVLYLFMPDCLTCYRCGARYRGPGVTERHGPFDLETHERHRQARSRLEAVSGHGGRSVG